MELWQVIKGVLQDPLLVCLLLVSTVLAVLSILQYFRAIRPRKGTTEWMQKIEPKRFGPIRLQWLTMADAVWALLVVLCAGCLRFCYLFFYLQLHQRVNALQVLLAASDFFIQRILLCVVFALSVFFLVRLLFGRSLPAILAAVIGALAQNHNNDTAALLALSLLLFVCWLGSSCDGGMLRGLWLIFSLGGYALCLLSCWETAWLSPLYVLGYLAGLLQRWLWGDKNTRVKKLILSLATMLLAVPAGVLALWIVYAHLSGRAEGGILTAMRTFSFYKQLLPVFKTKVYHLLTDRQPLLGYVVVYESFLFLLGTGACLPLLHGLIREKNSSDLLLPVLLLACLLLWLLSGVYLLSIPMLLILGRLWSIFCRRGKLGFCVLSACLLLGLNVICMILH